MAHSRKFIHLVFFIRILSKVFMDSHPSLCHLSCL